MERFEVGQLGDKSTIIGRLALLCAKTRLPNARTNYGLPLQTSANSIHEHLKKDHCHFVRFWKIPHFFGENY